MVLRKLWQRSAKTLERRPRLPCEAPHHTRASTGSWHAHADAVDKEDSTVLCESHHQLEVGVPVSVVPPVEDAEAHDVAACVTVPRHMPAHRRGGSGAGLRVESSRYVSGAVSCDRLKRPSFEIWCRPGPRRGESWLLSGAAIRRTDGDRDDSARLRPPPERGTWRLRVREQAAEDGRPPACTPADASRGHPPARRG